LESQEEIECLSVMVKAHVGKVATASQANLLAKLRKFVDADSEKTVIDHLFIMLARTNIDAYTNLPVTLAFMNCLCAFGQIKEIQAVQELQRYSTGVDSMLHTEAFFNTSPS